ncbi:hypothetical protein Nmel_015645 [Mimus melanotis]
MLHRGSALRKNHRAPPTSPNSPCAARRRGTRGQDGAAAAVVRVSVPPQLHIRAVDRAGRGALRARLRPGRGRALRASERRETVETHQAQV